MQEKEFITRMQAMGIEANKIKNPFRWGSDEIIECKHSSWYGPFRVSSTDYKVLDRLVDLMERLHQNGYTCTKIGVEDHNYQARFQVKEAGMGHIKIEVVVRSKGDFIYYPYAKDAKGKLRRAPGEFFTEDPEQIREAAKRLLLVPPPKLTFTPVSLGEPHGFKVKENFSPITGTSGSISYAYRQGVCTQVMVEKLVSLRPDRTLWEVSDPKQDNIWFLVYVQSIDEHRSPTNIGFHMITDGEGWYMVEYTDKGFRATPKTQRGKNLDLIEMCNKDRELIIYAITRYAETIDKGH